MTIDLIIANFREEVRALESDVLNVDDVKAWKVVRTHTGHVIDALESLKYENPEVIGVLERLYEEASLSATVDDTMFRKVSALRAVSEDLGLDVAEIDALIERWNLAMDKINATAKGKGAPAPSTEHLYGNTHDDFTSATQRGVKKHLTQVLGKGWYEANLARITRLEDGAKFDDKGNILPG